MQLSIDIRYNNSLSSVFGSTFFKSFVDNTFQEKLTYILERSGFRKALSTESTLEEILIELYTYLANSYRSEYIYKNTIANKLLLGKHDLNEAVLFTEFRSETALLDVLIVNGTTTAYEIKTELDSFERLPNQIAAYQSIFDKTFVVTCESFVDKLNRTLPEKVGILVLDSENNIVTVREAATNVENLCHENVFMSLRKPEYLQIIASKFGYIPEVPNTRIYKECLKLFSELPKEEVHRCFIDSLHKRKIKAYQINLVGKVAYCLKMLLLERNLSTTDCDNLYKRLQDKPLS